METVVFGKRVVEHIQGGAGGAAKPEAKRVAIALQAGTPDRHEDLQSLMWESGGIERHASGLRNALTTIASWREGHDPANRESFERRQMARLAALMLHSALERTESRGGHFRSDFPARDDVHWRRQQVWVRGD
jgi:L-aspartate oxidase